MNKWITYLGIPGALVACLVALDWFGLRPVLSREIDELKVEIAATSQGVQLIRWQVLEQTRKQRALTTAEMFEYCKLSRLLGFRGEGCA
jgi:hypothetical protein